MHSEICPICNGKGKYEKETCHGCNGKGWIEVRDEIGYTTSPISNPNPYRWDIGYVSPDTFC